MDETMSVQCDIARLVVRKQQLLDDLTEVRRELKIQCRSVDLPFAAEVDGMVVTVKKPVYPGDMPQTSVVPFHGQCDTVEVRRG
jgi:hypothetical protein